MNRVGYGRAVGLCMLALTGCWQGATDGRAVPEVSTAEASTASTRTSPTQIVPTTTSDTTVAPPIIVEETVPPPTAPATMPPVDGGQYLLQSLDLGPGWIPDPDYKPSDSSGPTEPPECDLPEPEPVTQRSIAFDNPTSRLSLLHGVAAYASEEQAREALNVLIEFANICPTSIQDGLRTDIAGPGPDMYPDSFVSFRGSFTDMSDGGVAGMEFVAVQRGTLVSSMFLIGRDYDNTLIGAMRNVLARTPD